MSNKLNSFLEKGYKIFAYISIVVLLLFINYFHLLSNDFWVNVKDIIIVELEILLLIVFNKFIINKLNNNKSKIIIIVLLLVFLILCFLSVYFFRVKYNWDFKDIMDRASDLANTGTTSNYYFKIFPNNWGALIITTISMILFGGSAVGAYIVNVLSIFIAVVFSVLSAKEIDGNKLAINTLILLIGCAPLYLYSPIVYTDTLSVAFPIATFYFWLKARKYNGKKNKKYYLNLILMTLMGLIGFCIKPVAAIVFVAIIIESVFEKIKKQNFKSIIIAISVFVIGMKLFNTFGEIFIIRDSRKNDAEFPITHWIMMGLNTPYSEGGTSIGYGAYSQEDTDFTSESGNYEEKKIANITKIKERLNNFGLSGYIDFLLKKFNYVWNDGSYYSLILIGWDTLNTESLPYKIIIGEESYKIFRPYMHYFNDMLFIVIITGVIIDVYKKQRTQEMRVLGITIVGIAIFLLIWEARSRYLYFLLPVFCIFGAIGLSKIEKCIEKIIIKIKNKKNFSNEYILDK